MVVAQLQDVGTYFCFICMCVCSSWNILLRTSSISWIWFATRSYKRHGDNSEGAMGKRQQVVRIHQASRLYLHNQRQVFVTTNGDDSR